MKRGGGCCEKGVERDLAFYSTVLVSTLLFFPARQSRALLAGTGETTTIYSTLLQSADYLSIRRKHKKKDCQELKTVKTVKSVKSVKSVKTVKTGAYCIF